MKQLRIAAATALVAGAVISITAANAGPEDKAPSYSHTETEAVNTMKSFTDPSKENETALHKSSESKFQRITTNLEPMHQKKEEGDIAFKELEAVTKGIRNLEAEGVIEAAQFTLAKQKGDGALGVVVVEDPSEQRKGLSKKKEDPSKDIDLG